MFSLDTRPAGLPFTTRSSLKALLKSRCRHREFSVPQSCKDWIYSRENPQSTSIEELEKTKYAQNREQKEDFSYSQKFFHIDDGNLYSVFSPLQGRAYGMKPSFLRKQKCTVQECQGRGRKSLRKGLKFHNFLPSESVTSQKDDSIKEDQWKVHSECKLREEHGTKQIMVSNWFQNVRQFRENNTNSENQASSSTSSSSNRDSSDNFQETSTKTTDIYNFQASLPSELISPNEKMETEANLFINKRNDLVNPTNKRSFLNSLLHSVASPQTAEMNARTSDAVSHTIVPNRENKHRRKPNQTRRVVPYTKYLSLMEETAASPLDLSLHPCVASSSSKNEKYNNIAPASVPVKPIKHVPCNDNNTLNNNVQNLQSSRNQSDVYSINNQTNSRIVPTMPTYIYPVSLQKVPSQIPVAASNSSQSGQTFHFQYKSPPSGSVPYNQRLDEFIKHQNTVLHSSSSKSKARRKSQRSVIKQKLEDTFRQNGFLVKTKQVSDGDATFCKFRQLRKYTRYYLKSWQQHLPDEVHKMWKGFLPPKTVLPPSSGNSHDGSDNPS